MSKKNRIVASVVAVLLAVGYYIVLRQYRGHSWLNDMPEFMRRHYGM